MAFKDVKTQCQKLETYLSSYLESDIAKICSPELQTGFISILLGYVDSYILCCCVFLFLLVFGVDIYFKGLRGTIFDQLYSLPKAVTTDIQ